jgi:tRNA-specific 2-thiouridylase
MTRVAVLMSGGVDSSVAALLTVRAGHEAVGITARMWRGASACSADEDIHRAQRVCHSLGMRHVVLDVSRSFERLVVGDFVASYLAGLTPNPCAICNRDVKFGELFRAALNMGCDQVASGHYARTTRAGGEITLAEPEDRRKSQVYFLALVARQVLPQLFFPLEGISKREVLKIAGEAGLPTRQGESQDLCFAVSSKYGDLVRGSPEAPGPGDVIDTEGRVIGKHRGHYAYTVGQRLGVNGRRLYVLKKDAAANRIVVGERAGALTRQLRAVSANYLLDAEARPGSEVLLRYRYNSTLVGGRITAREASSFDVALDEPRFAPAPGQVLACYGSDHLICGGLIDPVPDRS